MSFKNKTEIIRFFVCFFPSESQILCLPLIPALAAKCDKGGMWREECKCGSQSMFL